MEDIVDGVRPSDTMMGLSGKSVTSEDSKSDLAKSRLAERTAQGEATRALAQVKDVARVVMTIALGHLMEVFTSIAGEPPSVGALTRSYLKLA